MTARLALVRGRVLPNGWLDLLRQCGLFGVAYLFYRLVEGAVDHSASVAFAHGRDVIALERTLHVFVEPEIQSWATSSHFLMVVSTWVYINAQTTIFFGVLLYLYVAHNRSFYFVRNMLFVGMALGLVGYWVFPTAPPRFFPEWGFIDTVGQVTGVSHSSQGYFFNLYAAIPSIHVACAVMFGWTLVRLVRNRLAKAFWALWPAFVTFMTVITANHFFLDAALGLLVAGIALLAARRLAALRPHVWAFRGPSAQQGAPVPVT